jgi:DNA-binding MarR family transcriptional regulator
VKLPTMTNLVKALEREGMVTREILFVMRGKRESV